VLWLSTHFIFWPRRGKKKVGEGSFGPPFSRYTKGGKQEKSRKKEEGAQGLELGLSTDCSILHGGGEKEGSEKAGDSRAFNLNELGFEGKEGGGGRGKKEKKGKRKFISSSRTYATCYRRLTVKKKRG